MEFKEFKGLFWGHSSSKCHNWAQTLPSELVVLDLWLPKGPSYAMAQESWLCHWGLGYLGLWGRIVEFELRKYLKSGPYMWMPTSPKYLSALILNAPTHTHTNLRSMWIMNWICTKYRPELKLLTFILVCRVIKMGAWRPDAALSKQEVKTFLCLWAIDMDLGMPMWGRDQA